MSKFKIGQKVIVIKQSEYERYTLPINNVYIIREISSYNGIRINNEKPYFYSSFRFIPFPIKLKLLKIL